MRFVENVKDAYSYLISNDGSKVVFDCVKNFLTAAAITIAGAALVYYVHGDEDWKAVAFAAIGSSLFLIGFVLIWSVTANIHQRLEGSYIQGNYIGTLIIVFYLIVVAVGTALAGHLPGAGSH
jgi:Na+/melibiose symporter-like transporter